eukprot:COSAG06_NODE_753_length_12547_cov_928.116244_13_plen_264_part_00
MRASFRSAQLVGWYHKIRREKAACKTVSGLGAFDKVIGGAGRICLFEDAALATRPLEKGEAFGRSEKKLGVVGSGLHLLQDDGAGNEAPRDHQGGGRVRERSLECSTDALHHHNAEDSEGDRGAQRCGRRHQHLRWRPIQDLAIQAVQAVAAVAPASASSMAPATSVGQAWRKGKKVTPWSLLEATMVSQGHGYLMTAAARCLKPKVAATFGLRQRAAALPRAGPRGFSETACRPTRFFGNGVPAHAVFRKLCQRDFQKIDQN